MYLSSFFMGIGTLGPKDIDLAAVHELRSGVGLVAPIFGSIDRDGMTAMHRTANVTLDLKTLKALSVFSGTDLAMSKHKHIKADNKRYT